MINSLCLEIDNCLRFIEITVLYSAKVNLLGFVSGMVNFHCVIVYGSMVSSNSCNIKCFRKAGGILDLRLDVVNRGIEDDLDPFLESDECMELENPIEQTGGEGCTVDEFLTGDSDLPVCALRWMMSRQPVRQHTI